MSTDERSLIVIALLNRLVDLGVEPLRSSELWGLLDRVDDIGVLPGCTEDQLSDLVGDRALARRMVTLLDGGIALALRLQALQERGVWVLTVFDEGFPRSLVDSLGRAAPAVLYGAGDTDLLQRPGLALVGTADADPAGVELGRAVARLAADLRIPLVSAGDEADLPATEATIAAGGRAVAVPAVPLVELLATARVRAGILRSRLCVLTPYPPEAGWSVGTALGRNRVIHGLSRAGFVVSTVEGDIAWVGARQALDLGPGPVTVWSGPGATSGNAGLIAMGATPIDDLHQLAALLSGGTGDADPAAHGSI